MSSLGERRLALIHRVIVPDDEDYPKEYAILVTDRRSIFIRQEKTRRTFVLRGEMKYGTALVTDVTPKTLEDYEQTTLESLASDTANLVVQHDEVVSLALDKEAPRFRASDFFVRLTMRRQGEVFQVYHFDMDYRRRGNNDDDEVSRVTFYLVPLGQYFKPRRQTKGREAILREYALAALSIFREVLPASIIRA